MASFFAGRMSVGRAGLFFSERLHSTKHVAHAVLFVCILVAFELGAIGLWAEAPPYPDYHPLVTLLLQLLRILPFLALPQVSSRPPSPFSRGSHPPPSPQGARKRLFPPPVNVESRSSGEKDTLLTVFLPDRHCSTSSV